MKQVPGFFFLRFFKKRKLADARVMKLLQYISMEQNQLQLSKLAVKTTVNILVIGGNLSTLQKESKSFISFDNNLIGLEIYQRTFSRYVLLLLLLSIFQQIIHIFLPGNYEMIGTDDCSNLHNKDG